MATLRFFDLFAGIGGFRLALEREGYECVGFCEIDKWARKLYKSYYDTTGEVEYEDATKIVPELLPDFDVLCAGFPCQAFSIAGKRRGFEDTRGTLFFEIARIAAIKRPTYLLLENVKGLLSHDKGRTFETILKTLDELGYDAEWQVLNSKDFGVPQNRERVFIVGHFRGRSRPKVFPITETDKVCYKPQKAKKEICQDFKTELAGTLTARQYASWNGNFVAEPIRIGQIGKGRQGERIYSAEGVSTTLSANGGGRGAKTGLYLVYDPYNNKIKNDDVVGILKTNYSNGNSWIIKEGFAVRRLTPLECFRLQGFPDDIYYKAKELGISDFQLYKMIGNSVTVQVVQTIARLIKRKHS